MTELITAAFALLTAIVGFQAAIFRSSVKSQRQLFNNGGNSMKDAVDRLERGQRYIIERLDRHLDGHQ